MLMLKFTDLIDRTIIISCCLLLYFFQLDYIVNVNMVLTVLIFSGFLTYFDEERLTAALILGFIILSYYYPELIIFLPVIAYDMFFYRYQYLSILALAPLINFLSLSSNQVIALSLALLILGFLIRYRTEILKQLQN